MAAILVPAGLTAGAIYLATIADTSMANDELLPAGVYDSIEEAERAKGFKIPHARRLDGWRLESIEVSGPDYGVTLNQADDDLDESRLATLTYRSLTGQSQVSVTAFRTDSDQLQPIQGVGPSGNVAIGQHAALLQQNELANGRARLVAVQWLDNGLLVSCQAVLIAALEVSGRVVQPGVRIEELMALLGSFD